MHFFRKRADFALLALIALIVQLTMSLGHSHALRVSQLDTGLACRTITRPPSDRQCPPLHHDEHNCPICSAIGIAGALIVPPGPETVAPPGALTTVAFHRADASATCFPAAAFDARGPPLHTTA